MFYTVSYYSSLLVALQKHFKNLEALALDRDEPEEVIDYTGNDIIVAASSCCYERNLVPTWMYRSVMYPEKCCILIYTLKEDSGTISFDSMQSIDNLYFLPSVYLFIFIFMACTLTSKNHPMVPVDLIFPLGGQWQRKLIPVILYVPNQFLKN